jgi:hypothetical protein
MLNCIASNGGMIMYHDLKNLQKEAIRKTTRKYEGCRSQKLDYGPTVQLESLDCEGAQFWLKRGSGNLIKINRRFENYCALKIQRAVSRLYLP